MQSIKCKLLQSIKCKALPLRPRKRPQRQSAEQSECPSGYGGSARGQARNSDASHGDIVQVDSSSRDRVKKMPTKIMHSTTVRANYLDDWGNGLSKSC